MQSATSPVSLNNTLALKQSTFPICFEWKYGGSNVLLTGTFDTWAVSIPMKKNKFGAWTATVSVDLYTDNFYKFVVDGEWVYDMEKPHQTDESGNTNNFIEKMAPLAVKPVEMRHQVSLSGEPKAAPAAEPVSVKPATMPKPAEPKKSINVKITKKKANNRK